MVRHGLWNDEVAARVSGRMSTVDGDEKENPTW